MGALNFEFPVPKAVDQEKRQYQRAKAPLSIEILMPGAAIPSRSQTSDISLGGCYVESNFTMAVGTKVEVGLWLGEEKIVTHAEVVTRHASFGNGLRFADLSLESRNKLSRFLQQVTH
jgi:c-di-GMP-binding flagellar brake protein YcgR